MPTLRFDLTGSRSSCVLSDDIDLILVGQDSRRARSSGDFLTVEEEDVSSGSLIVRFPPKKNLTSRS